MARKPPEAAAQERRRIRRNANKKPVSPNPNSLIAAGFVMILTSLPAETVPAEEVMALCRLKLAGGDRLQTTEKPAADR